MHLKPKKNIKSFVRYFSGILLLVLSCSPRFTNVALPIEEVQEFSYNGNSVLEDKWWTAFEDEQLNMLIDSAMESNFDLAATWQQFLAAKATVSRAASTCCS